MNPNYTTYRALIFILGILGSMFLLVHQDAVNVMYPSGINSFSGIFYGSAVISLILGILLPAKSLRGGLVTLLVSLLFLMSTSSIVVGHFFAYNIKTDEFILYFLLSFLTALVYILHVVILGKLIIFRSGLDQKRIFQLILTMLVGFLVGYSLKLLFIESIHVWYGIVSLLLLAFYLTRKVTHPIPQESSLS
ncbi:MAG: hypothetical protein ABJP45_07185 [Cyclobacteriaceae bacterium]